MEKIGTVSGGSRSSFEDKTAKKGTTYYYAVRAGIKPPVEKYSAEDTPQKQQRDKSVKI